jgi:hypothetical protein
LETNARTWVVGFESQSNRSTRVDKDRIASHWCPSRIALVVVAGIKLACVGDCPVHHLERMTMQMEYVLRIGWIVDDDFDYFIALQYEGID